MEMQIAVQLRNNSSVIYWKSKEKAEGYKKTLKQNLKTEFCEALKELNDTKEIINLKEWYKKYVDTYTKKAKAIAEQKEIELKDIRVTGRTSKRTLKRVIENLVNIVYENYDKTKKDNAYLVFLTLTLPSKQIHTDKLIKRQLSLFIERLQIEYNVKNYVWRAEAQKNGNIHFHLLVDRFIDKKEVQILWNRIINRLGYVDRSGIENPNSTNIHGMGKSPDDVIRYVTKYLTKTSEESEYRGIIGRVWGCKQGLTKIKYFTLLGPEAQRVIDHIETHNFEDEIKLLIPFVQVYGVGINQIKGYFPRVLEKFKNRLKKFYYIMYESYNVDINKGVSYGY